MALGPEYMQVELKGMGWTHLEGAPPEAFVPTDPAKSGRTSFSEVFLTGRLRNQVNVLNRGPNGNHWLTPKRLDQAVNALARIGAPSLLEANQQATELLLNGITVEGLPGWDGGRDQRVNYVDWEHPERNDFVVVSQFRLDIPGMQGKKFIVPDEVLFINGIPFALVECKKPGTSEAMGEAIRQHLRYADRRGSIAPEGNPKLFHTMQLLVATCGDRAMLGSITSSPEHYAPWRDPYPLTKDELAQRLKKRQSAVSPHEILTGVVLHPYRLLDIVQNYVTFMQTDDGKTVKAVPRYQQYRAVCRAVERLRTGKTRKEDGHQDRRGGIIWHTQGSGKSLTMTFLVRKLRTTPGLKTTKVVVVTDRTQLQGQLSKTMELSGETVDIAKRVRQAKAMLSRHGPGIVFVMIQKQQDVAARRPKADSDDELTEATKTPSLGELNTDESIIVLIDEAHRSHSSTLHMNLMAALPNCARIGFTGTPILMGAKKKTTDIFGPYIDVYKLRDAEIDGAVVPILYSGRTVKGAVRDGRDLDEVFEDMFADHTPEELEEIQRRYATKGDVMEAEKLIAAKAQNILRHYVGTVLPNGFKAQLVAHSRRATLRYRDALLKARDELVAQIERLPTAIRDADPEDLDRRTAFLVRTARHLDLLKAIDFVPVISVGTANDEKDYEPWTEPDKQRQVIDGDFLKPFPDADELAAGKKPTAFLVVKSMLLTGFDAPVEQVLYLDRSMREAELLQAVARVNRPADGKEYGYVIDYAGVTNHLTQALKAYSAEDIRGALKGPARGDRPSRSAASPHPVAVHQERGRPRRKRAGKGGLCRPFRGRAATGQVRGRPEEVPVHRGHGAAAPRCRSLSCGGEAVRRDRDARPAAVPDRRRHVRREPVRGEGPRANRRAPGIPRRGPGAAARLDHLRRLPAEGGSDGQPAGPRIGDGARDSPPHQRAPGRGPDTVSPSQRTAGADPGRTRGKLGTAGTCPHRAA
jgi:type I restriction enzyme R subunit